MYRAREGLFASEAIATCIHAEEDEEQDGEAPERGTAVTEEGQRNADDRGETQHHADIDEDVEEEDAHDGIAVDAPKGVGLAFGKVDEAQDESQEQTENDGTSEEPFFLAYGAEYEVGVLFRHVLEFGLSAVEETLAAKSARTNGNLGLNDIVTGTARVVLHT